MYHVSAETRIILSSGQGEFQEKNVEHQPNIKSIKYICNLGEIQKKAWELLNTGYPPQISVMW